MFSSLAARFSSARPIEEKVIMVLITVHCSSQEPFEPMHLFRNRVRSKEERKHPLLVQREERRKLLGIKTAKELDQERNRAYDQERRNKKPKRGEVVTDLWSSDGEHIS